MAYNQLEFLPLGSIRPDGFLKEQLRRCGEGMGGHLDELEPDMIANPFVNKTYVPMWGDGDQSGWGAEISGNYYKGLIELAYTLGEANLIKKAETWVKAVIKKQRSDGYLGTYYEEDAKIYEDYNAWGTACGMGALLRYYDATGDEKVFDSVYRCMLWFCENWAGDKKTAYCGVSIVEIMVLCYRKTGDKRLIQFCEDYYRFLEKHNIFYNDISSFLSDEPMYNANHGAGYGVVAKLPALLYMITGNLTYLHATEKALQKVREKCMHITGGVVCNGEYLGAVSPISETEYCAFTFYNQAYAYLESITGNAVWGDACETLFYNGAQGARKKDERAIAYLSAPNQIFATDRSSASFTDMQVYAPCYPTACCPVNAVVLLPEFVRAMAMRDAQGNLYFTAYGPCSVKYGDLLIRVRTMYPFEHRIVFEVSGSSCCSLFFKIPGWSTGYTISVNGEQQTLCKNDQGFVAIERSWQDGDGVTLQLDARPEKVVVDDCDAHGKHPIAFRWGALVFSLPIPEKWEPIAGRPMTPLPEGWHWYNVEPDCPDRDGFEPHEAIGMRREWIPYNIAVDENLPVESIRIIHPASDEYVWENPPVKLVIDGYKAPLSYAPYINRTPVVYGEKQMVSYPLQLELVPYGCTNLRITYFPRAAI